MANLFGSSNAKKLEMENIQLKKKLEVFMQKFASLENLEKILDEAKSEVSGLTRKEEEIRQQLDTRTKDAEDRTQVLQIELQKLEQKKFDLETKVSELELSRSMFEPSFPADDLKYQELEGENERLRNEIESVKVELYEAKVKIEQLESNATYSLFESEVPESSDVSPDVDILRYENAVLQERVSSLQDHIKHMEEEAANTFARKSNEEYSEPTEVISAAPFSTQTEELLSLQNEVSRLTEELIAVKEKLDAAESELGVKDYEINHLHEQIASLRFSDAEYSSETLDIAPQDTSELEAAVSNRLEELQNAIAAAEAQKDYLNLELGNLRQEIENQKAAHSQEIEEFTKERAVQVQALEDELSAVKAELETKKTELDDIALKKIATMTDENGEPTFPTEQSALSELQTAISSREEIKVKLEKRLNELIQQLSMKESSFSDYENRRDTILIEIQQRQEELSTLEFDLRFQQEQLASCKEKIQDSEENLRQLKEEIKGVELTREELQKAVFKKRETEEVLIKSVQDLRSSISEMEERKSQMENNMLGVESQLSATLEKFALELQDVKTQMLMQKNLLDELDKNVFEKEHLHQDLEIALEEMRQDLSIAEKSRYLLQEQLRELSERKESAVGELAQVREKESSAQGRLKALKIDIETYELRKSDFERELRELLLNAEQSFKDLDETKKAILGEIAEYEIKLEKVQSDLKEKNVQLDFVGEEYRKTMIEYEKLQTNITRMAHLEKSQQQRLDQDESRELNTFENMSTVEDNDMLSLSSEQAEKLSESLPDPDEHSIHDDDEPNPFGDLSDHEFLSKNVFNVEEESKTESTDPDETYNPDNENV